MIGTLLRGSLLRDAFLRNDRPDGDRPDDEASHGPPITSDSGAAMARATPRGRSVSPLFESDRAVLSIEGLVVGDHFDDRSFDAIEAGRTRAEIARETGASIAISEATLDVDAGEVVALTGPRGAGASALLAAIAGRMTIAHGHATLLTPRGPLDPARDEFPPYVVAHATDLALESRRSLRWHVEEAADDAGVPRGERAERVAWALALVGLEGWGDRPAGEADETLRACVSIACAFVASPALVLLDRPFTNVDSPMRERLGDELRELAARTGTAVLVAADTPDEALRLGERVAVMDDGRILQFATPRRLLTAPAHERVREMLARVDRQDVLRAADIMVPEKPGTPRPRPRHAVRIGTGRLRPAIFALATHDTAMTRVVHALDATGLPVLVERGGEIIGTVTPEDVVRTLARR